MIKKEKENDINHFNSAKKYFNSNPSDYINSLKELNQISFLIQNISVMHMKILCLLMLSKYEEIIECYFLNKKFFEDFLHKNETDEEKNEIKKIIALAFHNFNGKSKAKLICPDIKDEYEYKIERFEIIFLKESKDKINHGKGLETGRINRTTTFKNIKKELDKNIDENKSKELMRVSSIFVDNLFDIVKGNNQQNSLYKSENNEINNEEKIEKESTNSNIYLKLKEEMSDIDNIQKEDGNLITFEEKIKVISSEKDKEKINENKTEIKIENNKEKIPLNEELKQSKEKYENKSKFFNTNNKTDDQPNIYSNSNLNINNSNNNNNKEKNKVSHKKSKEIPRKSCNPLSFVNPIEFTLSPGDVSFNNISGSFLNGESGEENNKNKQKLLEVVVDGENYFFMKNEEIDINNENNNFEEYINIDFSGNRNWKKKRTIKIKKAKSLMTKFDRYTYKNLEDFANEKENKMMKDIRKSGCKRTSVFKTNFILDNK